MASLLSLNDLDVPKVLVFYAPQMEGMAHHISKVSNTVQLCTVSWVRDVRDEGFKILNIEEPWRVPGSICVFLASFDSTEDIYEQFAVISKLPRLGAKMLKVIMPCFPSLTLRSEGGERGKGIPGEIPLSRTIARLMSAIPNAKTGPTELVIFDIHHLQERFYFDDNTVPRLETSMLLLADRLDEIIEQQVRASLVTPSNHGSAASAAALPFPWDEASQEEVVRLGSLGQLTSEENKQLKRIKVARRKYGDKAPMVAFSDEKTAKRFGKNFQGFQQIICTRMLKKEGQGRLMLLEGDPRGRRCVLVDDVIITGSTMIKCGQLLKDLGAVSVWVYATHAQFVDDAWKKFCTGLFERVLITDSCPKAASFLAEHGAPFEVVSLAPIIGPLIDEEAFLAAHHAMRKSQDQRTLSRL